MQLPPAPTPILDANITGPMAWVGSELPSIDEFAFQLQPKHVAALREILQRTRHIARDAIGREHCPHPDLDQDLAQILDEVQSGRGVVLLRGFPVAGESVEDVERMFWIVGTHLGTALSQYAYGEMLARVQEEKPKASDQSSRGSKASADLGMHTDMCEIMGLMCMRDAAEGGESHLASVIAVHNQIRATRPDLLPTLYRGFPYHRRGEQPDAQDTVSPYPVPVFCNVDGKVSTMYLRGHAIAGMAERGLELSPAELEALDAVRDVAVAQQVTFRMAPGDALVANNWTVFHSRSAFRNHVEPEKKRLYLRLWLEAGRDRRPIVPEMMIYQNAGGRHGVDALPGRTVDGTGYVNVSQKSVEILKGERG